MTHRHVPFALTAALMVALLGLPACSDTDDSDGPSSGGDAGADQGADAAVDQGGGAFEAFAGTWQLESITLLDADSTQTLTRDGEPAALRGDVRVSATGGSSGELRVRLIGLLNGLMLGEPNLEILPVTLDGSDWLIETNPGEISVYASQQAGDALTLTRDDDHPDDTAGSDGPVEIVVTRLDSPPGDVIGTWDLVSAFLSDDSTLAPTCTEASDEGYQISELTIEIDTDYLVAIETVDTSYSDAACTQVVGTENSTEVGAAEERGTSLDLWLFDEGSSQSLAFDVERTGNELTLTRQSCLPTPDCEVETPVSITLALQP